MRYVKHLSVALIALGLSAPVLANNTVCVPSQQGGLKIGIDALYLRTNAVTSTSDSSYDWGMYAQIGYLFPATANDLTATYTYLRTDDKDSMNLDTVDLNAGQRITSGIFDMRLFAGVRYNHLDYSLQTDESSTVSKFHGFGPNFGIDTRCQLGNCLGLDTHLNTGLVVGTLSNRYQDKEKGFSESMNHVVPNAGAKIGIDYTYALSSVGKSVVAIEVGYQSDHYFKAFDRCAMSGSNDLSTDGPYLDIKYYA